MTQRVSSTGSHIGMDEILALVGAGVKCKRASHYVLNFPINQIFEKFKEQTSHMLKY